MYTKEQLKKQLENMGLTGDETILIHSSMKSIGDFYFFQHIHGRI